MSTKRIVQKPRKTRLVTVDSGARANTLYSLLPRNLVFPRYLRNRADVGNSQRNRKNNLGNYLRIFIN